MTYLHCMQYFAKDFSLFFRELANNNNKAWFHVNRRRYEQSVKNPFSEFLGEVIRQVQGVDPGVKIRPADAITRINKNTRFSKDKTPYNTHVGAVISKAGKKDKSVPAIYIRISPDKVTLCGGAYVLDPAQLKNVRDKIIADPGAFSELYNDKAFKAHFANIKGEQSKRLEPTLAKAAEQEPLIANKQFYFEAELNPSVLNKEELADIVLAHYKAGKAINEFLHNALR
jgi:uncharacterized protein (TIGR02453 family)